MLLILSLFLVAMIGASAMRLHAAEADETINAVYFVGESPMMDSEQAKQAGIRITRSATEFQAAAASARTIIVDREMVQDVPRDWLADQFRQGKLIVGLNIPSLELADYAGNRAEAGNLGNFLQDFGGQPFYSWFYKRTELSGVGRSGSSSDIIYSTEDFLAHLRGTSESSQADYTPTRSPAEPPAPVRPHP
jgi:hypothetical protein